MSFVNLIKLSYQSVLHVPRGRIMMSFVCSSENTFNFECYDTMKNKILDKKD